MVIISILLLALIGLATWNAYNFKQIRRFFKNQTDGQTREFSNERYFELKYHIQFLVGISTILITAIGFFGYNSLETVKNEIKNEARKELETQLKQLNDSITIITNRLEDLKLDADKVQGSFSQVEKLNSIIKNISENNILKLRYYIVSELQFNPMMMRPTNYKFVHLFSQNGKLPKFKNPPILIAVPDQNVLVKTFNVTTESFDVKADPLMYDNPDSSPYDGRYISFTLILFER